MDEKMWFNIDTGEAVVQPPPIEVSETLGIIDGLIESNSLMLEKLNPTLHPGQPIPASGPYAKYARSMGLLNAARLKEKKLLSNLALLAAIKNGLLNKNIEVDMAKQLMKALRY